ncbi:MAG: malate synthase A [Gammaproteobacteria bacterium]|nr:malate synthase A [Gammaproteobacteria bacterium]
MATQAYEQSSPAVELTGQLTSQFKEILTPAALDFIAALAWRFTGRRDELLARRLERQTLLDAGVMPDFLEETAEIRASNWQVAPPPADLQDRRVEITGPVDRKMIINGLNSGAKVFMADFEDAHAPTWAGTMQGQINLRDAVNGSIEFTNNRGKQYRLNDEVATLIVRPRGWHLPEKNVLLDGLPVPAALLDFGLYIFHNAHSLLERGSGPYFYLPKLENHVEARLWNDVFKFAEKYLRLPPGSIRVTVLIETILAAFEMDEILYELRDHVVGLNCGRWDYIFSFIKCFHKHPEYVLADRAQLTMAAHFMNSYSLLLIKTCHRRGAHAMGGMAAQIPIKDDSQANECALAKVRADKEREARNGHDGTWVAHPGLVRVAEDIFNRYMPEASQKHRQLGDLEITAHDLLAIPEGAITEAGFTGNVCAALRYIAAWRGGQGSVPIHNLMEDVATAEIARAQLWQWIRYPKGVLSDGRKVTAELFEHALTRELALIRAELGDDGFEKSHAPAAAELLRRLVTDDRFAEFLTLRA